MPPQRLGERLVAQGLLSPASVRRALGFQEANAPRVRLGSILLNWDLIDETALLEALAAWYRCEPVTGEMLLAAPVEVARALPASQAIRCQAMPYATAGHRLRVAFVDPSNLPLVDDVAAVTGRPCVPGVATEIRLLQAHRRFYGRAIPFELRPTAARRESARVARPAPAAAEIPEAIQIVAEPSAPEPPSPPREAAPAPLEDAETPPPPVPEAAAADPHGGHWLASVPEAAESDAVRGMWRAPAAGDDLGDLALACVPADFPRAILWRESGGVLAGWRARGIEEAALDLLRFGVDGPSVFAAVLRGGTPHFGRVDPGLWPDPLPRILPGPPPCAVFPFHAGPRGSGIVFADRRGAPMRFDDTGLVARAAAEVAALLVDEETGH